MDLKQLHYFIEIANVKNMSKAARHLYISQPALSMTIKKIERDLNTELFNHKVAPYELTEVGQFLYERGSDLLEDYNDMLEGVRRLNAEDDHEKIKLGITTMISVLYMEELTEFIRRFPKVELSIIQDGSYNLQERLAHKDLDIAIMSGPNFYSKSVSFEPLTTQAAGYHICAVLPLDHPLADREQLSLEELRGENMASLSMDFTLGRWFDKKAQELEMSHQIKFYQDDLTSLIHSVRSSDVVTLLALECQSLTSFDDLSWIPLTDEPNYLPIGIGLNKEKQPTKMVDTLIDIIKSN